VEVEKSHMRQFPYASLVESPMYTMVHTWLDITQFIGIVSRFMSNNKEHMWNGL